MCAPVGVRRITFGAVFTFDELPRLRPHRFHTSFACIFPGYPQHAVDNFSTGIQSVRRALTQRAQQKTRGIDRFGKMPPQAHALIETHRLRLAAKPLGITKIDAGEAVIGLQFVPNPPVDAMRIIEMVQKHKHIKLAGQDKLRIETRSPDLAVRVATVKETLRALGAPNRAGASR